MFHQRGIEMLETGEQRGKTLQIGAGLGLLPLLAGHPLLVGALLGIARHFLGAVGHRAGDIFGGMLFFHTLMVELFQPGGNGVAFDWTLLGGLPPDLDYLLSGGLNAANVGEAIRLASPPGLDISSGVESAPGVKDVALIRDFFSAVRAIR